MKQEPLDCINCGEPMHYIYDRRIRESCWLCTGEVKFSRPEEPKRKMG